jgi:hypothetical protein
MKKTSLPISIYGKKIQDKLRTKKYCYANIRIRLTLLDRIQPMKANKIPVLLLYKQYSVFWLLVPVCHIILSLGSKYNNISAC